MPDVFVPTEDPKATRKGVRDATLRMIADERDAQLLLLHTYRDATTLAGEQVQDKRLDLLEDPPDVSATEVLLDALISLAVTRVTQLPIRALTTRWIRSMTGIRAAVATKNGQFGVGSLTSTSFEAARRIILDDAVENLVDPSREEFEYYKKFVEDVADPLEALARQKATSLAKKRASQARPTGQDGGDTASVAVRRAALTWARLQEGASDRSFAALRDQVATAREDKRGDRDVGYIRQLVLRLWEKREQATARLSNGDVEDILSRLFEAAIWVRHFGGVDAIVAPPRRDYLSTVYSTVYVPDFGTRLTVPEKLATYWLHRFRHPLGDGTKSFIEQQQSSKPQSFVTPRESALNDLLKWMRMLEREMNLTERRLSDFGFDVLGPVKPKK
jgi:hypothetical protein